MFGKISKLMNELNARISTQTTMLMWQLEARAEAQTKTLELRVR